MVLVHAKLATARKTVHVFLHSNRFNQALLKHLAPSSRSHDIQERDLTPSNQQNKAPKNIGASLFKILERALGTPSDRNRLSRTSVFKLITTLDGYHATRLGDLENTYSITTIRTIC